jgi:hypothetical protein
MNEEKTMLSTLDRRQIIRRSAFILALLAALIAVGLLLNAVSATPGVNDFQQARDFPRGALVYVQFSDLPAMLKQWEGSELKSRYVKSASYEQLQTRHLAMKLVSRWTEFNDATGFPIDAAVLSGLADDRAALAVYDLGKLDLLLVAPLSEAKLAACRFFQNKANFQTAAAPSGATYYLHDVEADKGRRKQRIGFAALQGKLILATDEEILLRAIANLEGGDQKDRLTDEPSFQTLAEAAVPHFASVWVDQEKLNDNPYFKNYWLMSEASDLKEIRAGMFDLDLQQGKWIERRDFLTTGNEVKSAAIPVEIRDQMVGLIPANAPYLQLRAAGERDAAILAGAVFDRKKETPTTTRNAGWERVDPGEIESESGEESEEGSSRYAYLNHRYDIFVDDQENEEAAEKGPKQVVDGEAAALAAIDATLKAAHPIATARLARPRVDDGPLFAEFSRAAVFALQTPAALDAPRLEQAIARIAAGRLMVTGARAQFVWSDQPGSGIRIMTLPALGRSVGYGLRGSMLIVSNHPGLLADLMKPQSSQPRLASPTPVQELTVVRLRERKAAFDDVFQKLESPAIKAYWEKRKGEEGSSTEPAQTFFSGNLASLLDVAAPVAQLRIERRAEGNRMKEEVIFEIE